MMIKKISRLKNFGIFNDFTWGEKLEFKKFNLIYGLNGSGKSTLSRVFMSCEKKCTYDENNFRQYPQKGEFTIECIDGNHIKSSNIKENNLNIIVFNQDFIDNNIAFDTSSCTPIIYISEEDKKNQTRLQELKQNQTKLDNELNENKKIKEDKQKTNATFLTGLGRELANTLFDKSYNRNKAEKKIQEIGFDNFTDKILPEEDLKNYQDISKSEQKKKQETLDEFKFSFSCDNKIIDSFTKIFQKTDELRKKEVTAKVIDRLKDDPVVNDWVKKGFDLYKNKEKDNCLFCQNKLGDDFFSILQQHFSKDYENLQNSIVSLQKEMQNLKQPNLNEKNYELYPNLNNEYETEIKKLNQLIQKINEYIDITIKNLQEKIDSPFTIFSSSNKPDDFTSLYNESNSKLNKIIEEHNRKASNHPTQVVQAKEKLELHYIAEALKDGNYKKTIIGLEEVRKKENEIQGEIDKNKSEIQDLEKQSSNIAKAITDINKNLEQFFGRKEIQLILNQGNNGYRIIRNGVEAKNLSEGEKTAVAFSYFITRINEQGFDKQKGIVFIDDPISSFDSNAVYHCVSLIKKSFKEVGQLFISTHNFQFFNLMKDWLSHLNQKKHIDFFMIENFFNQGIRNARIVELDPTLKNYKSEYQFLFVKLKKFAEKSDIEYDDSYTIGNIARRFFEIFINFKIPTDLKHCEKINQLIKTINDDNTIEKISPVDLDKTLKIFNEFSHNYNPTSAIEHKDKTEIKSAINIMFKIIREADQKHFDYLEEIYAKHSSNNSK